jgi:hypothetical protein
MSTEKKVAHRPSAPQGTNVISLYVACILALVLLGPSSWCSWRLLCNSSASVPSAFRGRTALDLLLSDLYPIN